MRAPTVNDVHELRAALKAYDGRPKKRSDAMADLTDLTDIGDILVGTGARIGEVPALRWIDVDLAAGKATITGTTAVKARERLVRQPIPKSEKSNRTLSLPMFAVDVLVRRRLAS